VLLSGGRRQIATTFWGKAWCENLERYSDFANRLPRGRAYVRNGLVVDLHVTPGLVEALVAGSDLYRIRIGIARIAPARWRRVAARCTGRIGSLVSLLRGELSADVLAILADAREGLFPEPRDIAMACSCPDWASMCKHVAATLYGIGARLDDKPELFFALRRADVGRLVGSATARAVPRPAPGAATALAASRLGEIFGIELEGEAAPPPPRRRSAASSRPAARAGAAGPRAAGRRRARTGR
jgi:uncharacterized Zn finger protein